jgi:hypothetical protein
MRPTMRPVGSAVGCCALTIAGDAADAAAKKYLTKRARTASPGNNHDVSIFFHDVVKGSVRTTRSSR